METVTVRVPAKINLVLRVGPLRNGFHDLATLFHAVSLFDDVTATESDDLRLTVTGTETAGVPLDDTNLAARAARLLADRAGVKPRVHLQIHKGIPVAGGMAGGSADAAGALVACDALWLTGFSRADLALLAAELGSDVPFSLTGGTAVGTGRGVELTPVLTRGSLRWVVAVSDHQLSTPAVFAECDRQRSSLDVTDPALPAKVLQAVRTSDPFALGPLLGNDLQGPAVALVPQLGRVLEVGRRCGALASLVSGSGPTCVFLAPDIATELDLCVSLAATGLVKQVHRCSGPVPGARRIEVVPA